MWWVPGGREGKSEEEEEVMERSDLLLLLGIGFIFGFICGLFIFYLLFSIYGCAGYGHTLIL